MAGSSKDLLDLERKNTSSSIIKSKLLVCKNNDSLQTQNPQRKGPKPPEGIMPVTSSVPKSEVLGKVKDFLGVISDANKRLQDDAKDNAKDYDIEVLTENTSEYIEMDLMLGVAELHTPEAVAAAEASISGYQPVISLEASCSGMGSEDSSDDSSKNETDDDDDDATCSPTKLKQCKPLEGGDSSSKPSGNSKSKKRQKIIELL